MKFLVAQLGARMHYAIPQMLNDAGLLDHFFTDICAVKSWPQILSVLPDKFRPAGIKRLLGRVPAGVPKSKITALTSLGWQYHKAKSVGGLQAHLDYGKKFCEAVVANGFGEAEATYTFNSAGLEIMRAAQNKGLRVVMEQTIAPRAIEQEILQQAAEKYRLWADSDESDPAFDAFIRREEEEWQYADLILCGSSFVLDGIVRRGGHAEKCRVVPYGVDTRFNLNRVSRNSGPLRVLTVGQVGLRKGSPVVWDAARLVGSRAQFRMVGSIAVRKEVIEKKPDNVDLLGAVPRSEILQHYEWADVFLLPSLCEGSATVTYEAMMAGLPVVCTENTGSIVEDGVSGLIVPILDPAQVAQTIYELIDKNDLLGTLSVAAAQRSKMATLDAYRERLLVALCGVDA